VLNNKKKVLSISKFSNTHMEDVDLYLGPWCTNIDYFMNNIDKFIIKDINNNKDYFKFFKLELENTYEYFLENIVEVLNNIHSVKYSQSFWKILTIDWFYSVSPIFHYYYNAIDKIKNKNYFVQIDDSIYPFEKMSQFHIEKMEDSDIAVVQHSMISFIVKNISNSLLEYEYKNINYSKSSDFIRLTRKPKPKLLKKLFWTCVNKKKSKILSYGLHSLNKFDMLQLSSIKNGISFKYKDEININYKQSGKRTKLLDNLEVVDFQSMLYAYLISILPTTLLEEFDRFIANSNDYINKNTVVLEQSFFQDEVLFEVALAKEVNSAKIVCSQSGGYGMAEYYTGSMFSFEASDYFLSWGYNYMNKYNTNFISVPMALTSDGYNIHDRKYDDILFLMNEMSITFYYHTNINDGFGPFFLLKNFSNYIKENNKNIFNSLKFKVHPGRIGKTLEETFLDNLKFEYNMHDDDNITIKNCALVVTDYIGTSLLQCMKYNTPIILIYNDKTSLVTDEFMIHLKNFKDVGILFTSYEEAAKQVINIYYNLNNYWNSISVQTARRKFIKEYVLYEKNWKNVLLKTLNEIKDV